MLVRPHRCLQGPPAEAGNLMFPENQEIKMPQAKPEFAPLAGFLLVYSEVALCTVSHISSFWLGTEAERHSHSFVVYFHFGDTVVAAQRERTINRVRNATEIGPEAFNGTEAVARFHADPFKHKLVFTPLAIYFCHKERVSVIISYPSY